MTESEGHIEKGLAAFKASDLQTAITELEEATRKDPTNYRAFNFLGAAYAGKGKYNAAIGAFKSAEQINPNVASIHFNLGQAYEAAGVPTEAEYEYDYALRLDPTYSRAQDALKALRARLRHEAEANSSE
ncbi:MAG: tetratricopeptide repeat protein [Armatimonadota bacterium]|nr:tetratricopeptide repeat protein [Armatimonadota bacterium]